MKKKTKVLCYIDSQKGRDVEILLPIVYFAERFLNCHVQFVLIYDIYAIYRYQPDLVLTSNITGSPFHYRIAKYAFDQNIKVFALFSEGNFPSDNKYNYFGSNIDKKFFQEYVCCWSKRIQNYLIEQHPEQQKKIKLTGAIGFDRYKIFNQNKNIIVTEKIKKKFKFIVGYAGWGFGRIDNELRVEQLIRFYDNKHEIIDFLAEQRESVFQILKKVIEENPDVLFVLKKHPQETRPCDDVSKERNEMTGLEGYENVIYLSENENIYDVMGECDVWAAYESTSILEYWMMKDNPVIIIAPKPLYKRSDNFKGCVNTVNTSEVQFYLNEYKSTKSIKDYYSTDKIKYRDDVLANSIGFTDGMNHIRASFYLNKVLNKIEKEGSNNVQQFSFKYFIMYVFMRVAAPFYSKRIFRKVPKLKKTLWVFDNFRLDKLKEKYSEYKLSYSDFYSKYNIEEKFNNGTLFKELIHDE